MMCGVGMLQGNVSNKLKGNVFRKQFKVEYLFYHFFPCRSLNDIIVLFFLFADFSSNELYRNKNKYVSIFVFPFLSKYILNYFCCSLVKNEEPYILLCSTLCINQPTEPFSFPHFVFTPTTHSRNLFVLSSILIPQEQQALTDSRPQKGRGKIQGKSQLTNFIEQQSGPKLVLTLSRPMFYPSSGAARQMGCFCLILECAVEFTLIVRQCSHLLCKIY